MIFICLQSYAHKIIADFAVVFHICVQFDFIFEKYIKMLFYKTLNAF